MLKAEADSSCKRRNQVSTRPGVLFRSSQAAPIVNKPEASIPTSGETTMNTAVSTIFLTPSTAKPPLATPAPINPPTSACDELDGSPHHQVNRFQVIAP